MICLEVNTQPGMTATSLVPEMALMPADFRGLAGGWWRTRRADWGRMGDEARSKGRRRLVLPRVLRRPARILSRLDWAVPKHTGLKLAAAFLALTGITGMVMGGHTLTVTSAVTAWCGLAIDQVEIKGQSETSEVDVLEKLALGDYPSIVTLDVTGARERIESLPWVKEVTLRKIYPNTLQIEVKERKPFAVWQRAAGFALIEKGGRVISDRVDARYASLPLVVGEGADLRAEEFVG
jgi:cell division protein FtsQ